MKRRVEVILLREITGLGAESDLVKVAPGYARNYLFPQGWAIPVTGANKHRLEALRQRRTEREAKELNTLTELGQTLSKLTLVITVKTGEDGTIFGSVTAGTIADELRDQFDVAVDKRKIHLTHPIKTLGEHEIEFRLHTHVNSAMKVRVESSNPLAKAPEAGSELTDSSRKWARKASGKEASVPESLEQGKRLGVKARERGWGQPGFEWTSGFKGAKKSAKAAKESAPAMCAAEKAGEPEPSTVTFTVTTPKMVVRRQVFVIDVWAHRSEDLRSVLKRAEEQEKQELCYRSKGPVKLRAGRKLTIELACLELLIDQPTDEIYWDGEITNASFFVTVPDNAPVGRKRFVATVSAGALPVVRLIFLIEIGSISRCKLVSQSSTTPRNAFASYAREDSDLVLVCIQGMLKIAGSLTVFIDVLSLRAGDYWEKELERGIARSNVFYLFWSKSASESEWVEREWRYALEKRGLDFIDPVPLVSPQIIPPPPELAERHFDDWVLAFRRYCAR